MREIILRLELFSRAKLIKKAAQENLTKPKTQGRVDSDI